MNKSLLTALLWLALMATPLYSQALPLSQETVISPMSGNAHWVLQAQSLGNKVTTPPVQAPGSSVAPDTRNRKLIRTDTTRSNGLLRRINTWDNGTQTERWWQGAFCLIKEPQFDTIFIIPWASFISNEATYEQFSASDFPELRWVAADTFLEWTTLGDRTVALYGQKQSNIDLAGPRKDEELLKFIEKTTGKRPDIEHAQPTSPTSREGYARLAWIDTQTKRPLALEAARSRISYSFTEGEVPPIELPQAFRESVGRYLEAASVQTLDVKF